MARRAPVQREKAEQARVCDLLRSLGGVLWIAGTRRGRGRKCPKCATFVPEDQSTHQTAGLPDIPFCFLPSRTAGVPDGGLLLLVIECKAAEGGRFSPEQRRFAELCGLAKVAYVGGGLDCVIAWLLERGYVKASGIPHYRLPAHLRTLPTPERS